jgi:hypothetical protein
MNKKWIAALIAVAALLIPTIAYAQSTNDEGILLRIGGDVTLAADETVEALIVIDGDALVLGTAEDVIVVSGSATLTDANVRNVVVLSGDVTLNGSTHVRNEVRLLEGTLDRGPDVTVDGGVRRGGEVGFGAALGVVSVLIYLGFSVTLIVLAVVIAAFAGRQANAAGRAITGETGAVALSALILWIALPLAAIGAFVTVIGIPTGLVILVMVVPAFIILGYTVAGIRLGTWILGRSRDGTVSDHPFLGAVIGVGLLQLVAWIPAVGFLVATIAGLAGSGAIALMIWRGAHRGGTPAAAGAESEIVPVG